MNKMIKKKTIFILITILFFYFFIKVSFLKNLYEVLFLKYDDRISNVYGFCSGEGVGYTNFIKKKYKIKEKITLISELNSPSQWAIYNTNYNKDDLTNHYIVINYNRVKDKIDIKNFKILNNINDCYYLVKND